MICCERQGRGRRVATVANCGGGEGREGGVHGFDNSGVYREDRVVICDWAEEW